MTEHRQARDRLVRRAALTSILGRTIAAGCTLIQIPIALKYLGKEAFGFWSAIAGFNALLSFADLGLGNGLQNRVAEFRGHDDLAGVRGAWLGGVRLLAIIGAVLFAAAVLSLPLVNWQSTFGLADPKIVAAAPLCGLLVALNFCVSLPFASVTKVMAGLQLSWISNLYLALGSILALICTWFAIAFGWGLPAFLIATLATQPVTMIALGWKLWHDILPPHGGPLKMGNCSALLRTGVQFLLPQLGVALMFVVPPMLIAGKFGASVVVPYALTTRVLSIGTQFLGFFLFPLWPAYGEAKVRKDHPWIVHKYRQSINLAVLLGAVPCLAFALVGNQVLALWTQAPAASFDRPLIVCLSIWAAAGSISQATAVLLNGLGYLTGQAIYGTASVVLALGCMPLLADKFGTTGIGLAAAIPFAAINLPCALFEAQYRLKAVTSPRMAASPL